MVSFTKSIRARSRMPTATKSAGASCLCRTAVACWQPSIHPTSCASRVQPTKQHSTANWLRISKCAGKVWREPRDRKNLRRRERGQPSASLAGKIAVNFASWRLAPGDFASEFRLVSYPCGNIDAFCAAGVSRLAGPAFFGTIVAPACHANFRSCGTIADQFCCSRMDAFLKYQKTRRQNLETGRGRTGH
jgi:hypothetical protein